MTAWRSLEETKHAVGAALGALKDTGHCAKNVRTVLLELLASDRPSEPLPTERKE